MVDIDMIKEPLLLHGDCLELMNHIPDRSIDFICCDLPFGTTQNEWDVPLPLEDHILYDGFQFNEAEYLLYVYSMGVPHEEAMTFWKANRQPGLWAHYKRILKERGCVALFCQTPFDVVLGKSNLPMLKYEWILEKTRPTGFLNAKRAPMKAHEKVLIFYKKAPIYNPQMTEGHPPVHNYVKRHGNGNCYGATGEYSGGGSTQRYPRDVLRFKWDTRKVALHQAQKPVEMMEYFVKTYTNEGDLVLDNCMGSCSTGVACKNTGRRFIGMEIRAPIYELAVNRINNMR